jgi:hypothetical protein
MKDSLAISEGKTGNAFLSAFRYLGYGLMNSAMIELTILSFSPRIRLDIFLRSLLSA